MKCENCKFWNYLRDTTNNEKIGYCRRYPPSQQRGSSIDDWSMVFNDDWCGEFTKKRGKKK